ncbi:S-adenosyl-L-methionine-dependent methyltransferase [Aspergillus pseudoustus]|uniref:S-adenosyl-L-methionine-dependent methyltransferase n=1 Tax=Aspergillus pseudoustus TaxID=1810923 RepID=A0ABR4IQW7_9EURO
MTAIALPNYAWLQRLNALKPSIQIQLTESEATFEEAMVHSAFHFIDASVKQLKHDDQEYWEWHQRVMYDWMAHTVQVGNRGDIRAAAGSERWASETPETKQALLDYLGGTGDASARLMIRVGRHLVQVFRGEMTPLELVTEDNLLSRYYMEYPKLKDRTYKHLREVSEVYARSHPDAKILEIGAGTGGATKVLLQAFDAMVEQTDAEEYPHYTFTDVSTGFFPAAAAKLASWAPDIDFCKLDIERDPEEQGFEPGSFDLVLASLVLHATRSLYRTLTNVRKLLRPGGTLLLIETTRDVADMQLIFGLFEGWWLSEEEDRKMSPNVSTDAWDKVMRETGFTGAEFEIRDCEDAEYQSTSLLVSSASWPL